MKIAVLTMISGQPVFLVPSNITSWTRNVFARGQSPHNPDQTLVITELHRNGDPRGEYVPVLEQAWEVAIEIDRAMRDEHLPEWKPAAPIPAPEEEAAAAEARLAEIRQATLHAVGGHGGHGLIAGQGDPN